MKNRVLTLAATAAVVLGLAASASAQGAGTTTMPTFEIGAGYQLFHIGKVCNNDPLVETCSADRTFPVGLAVDAVRNFGPLGIVGEGAWAYDSDASNGVDVKFNNWHVAGGARWTARSAKFWPYGQLLAGINQDRISADGATFDNSQTSFMLQPGVGATYVVGDGWGLFGQIDYRRVFLDGDENLSDGRNDFRLFFGARMILD